MTEDTPSIAPTMGNADEPGTVDPAELGIGVNTVRDAAAPFLLDPQAHPEAAAMISLLEVPLDLDSSLGSFLQYP